MGRLEQRWFFFFNGNHLGSFGRACCKRLYRFNHYCCTCYGSTGTTRLRIELTYDYYGGGTYNTLTTACTDAYNYYGETEDYAVTVQPLSGFNVASTRKVQPQVFGVDSNLFEFAFQNLGADTVYWLDLGYSLDWGTPELVLNYTPKGGTLYPRRRNLCLC
jgi:hypothetical protein